MAELEATTVIGPTIQVTGQLHGDENVTVYGRVTGQVELTQTLLVAAGAIVQADISVRQATIEGIVVGHVVATDRIDISASARVVGDITAPLITIAAGARVRGMVDAGGLADSATLIPLAPHLAEHRASHGGVAARPGGAARQNISAAASRPTPLISAPLRRTAWVEEDTPAAASDNDNESSALLGSPLQTPLAARRLQKKVVAKTRP